MNVISGGAPLADREAHCSGGATIAVGRFNVVLPVNKKKIVSWN